MRSGPSWVEPRGVVLRWLAWVGPGLALAIGAAVVAALYPWPADLTDAGLRADARVVSVSPDVLRYDHVVVGEVEVDVRGLDDADVTVEVRYDLDDPYRVMVVGVDSSDDVWDAVVGTGVLAAPLVILGVMLRSAARTRRLADSEEHPSFVMFGLVHPARLSTVPRLSLYALDARPGDGAICTVRLADDTTMAGPGYDTVEVKGWPRPGGRVVVRRNGQILWPRGRALLVTGPAFAGGDPSSGTGWAQMVQLTRAARRRQSWFWVAASVAIFCALLTAVVLVVTRVNQAATERWLRDGSAAVATVRDESFDDFAIPVLVRVDGAGEGRPALELSAPVDYPEDFEPGQRYPATVSADGTRVRLRAEPYDAWEPPLWPATIGALAGWLAIVVGPARRLGRGPRPEPPADGSSLPHP